MESIHIKTKGFTDIIDITSGVADTVSKKGMRNGTVHLFVIGSTASLSTCERDENAFDDIRQVLEQVASYKHDWKHHQTWGDDNGAAHIRAAIFGPSLTVPVVKGELVLGTWQKIILLDFDTGPREREIIISFHEEK